ncbi:hypothetical protein MmazTMA_11420 [Methanosarcina mazei]|nr:hypothetical protein MmazTMA_11420 [Methanosarcina mazei]
MKFTKTKSEKLYTITIPEKYVRCVGWIDVENFSLCSDREKGAIRLTSIRQKNCSRNF